MTVRRVAGGSLLLLLLPVAAALDASVETMRVTGPDGVATRWPHLDGTGIVVAIIDTGVSDDHETFRGARLTGVDASVPCNPLPGREMDVSCYLETNPEDGSFHGTHVAGILVGRGDDRGRMRGVAPGARFVEVKAADALPIDAPDAAASASTTRALEGIARGFRWVERWNAAHPPGDPARIDIVSCSCGIRPDADMVDLRGLAERLVHAGVVVVASAGNCGTCGPDRVGSPAISPLVIAAGGLDDRGTRTRADDDVWSRSSRGPNGDARKPDVLAPAVSIESSARLAGFDTWVEMNGTSMSAPHVAGVAALLLQADPSLTPIEVGDILRQTASGSPTPGAHHDAWGWGSVDAHAAVRAALLRHDRAPVAHFEATPALVGQPTRFDGRASTDPDGDALTFAWDLGDGNVSDKPVVEHAYAAPGTYHVRLTVTDPLGSNATKQVAVLIRAPPIVARLHASLFEGWNDTEFRFDANASEGVAPLAFTWAFPDGTNATGATVARRFDAAGDHTLRLTVRDALGRVAEESVTVRVLARPPPPPLPALVAAIDMPEPDASRPLTFRASGTFPEGTTFAWEIDGVALAGREVTRTLAPGERVVHLTARAPDGREANATRAFVVPAPAPPAPSPGPTPAAEPEPQPERPEPVPPPPAATPIRATPTPSVATPVPPAPAPSAPAPTPTPDAPAAAPPAEPDEVPVAEATRETPLPAGLAVAALLVSAWRTTSRRDRARPGPSPPDAGDG